MEVVRAQIELEYEDMRLMCNYYPADLKEPMVIEINGQEYIGVINITRKNNSFIIKVDVCK